MKRIGILLDSFGGIPRDEIEAKGYELIPLSFAINGKEYLDDAQNPSLEEMANLVKEAEEKGYEKRTSLPSIAIIEEKIKKLTSEFENVIYLSISSKISSTFQTVSTLAQEHKNFYAIDTHFVGYQFMEIAQKIEEKIAEGENIEDVVSWVKAINNESLIYIIPKKLTSLIQSGRLTGVKKLIMTSLNFIPLLKYDSEGISADGIKRTVKGAITKAVEREIKWINGIQNVDNYNFYIVYVGDQELLEVTQTVLANHNIRVSNVSLASAIVATHTGYGTIAVGVWPKIW